MVPGFQKLFCSLSLLLVPACLLKVTKRPLAKFLHSHHFQSTSFLPLVMHDHWQQMIYHHSLVYVSTIKHMTDPKASWHWGQENHILTLAAAFTSALSQHFCHNSPSFCLSSLNVLHITAHINQTYFNTQKTNKLCHKTDRVLFQSGLFWGVFTHKKRVNCSLQF